MTKNEVVTSSKVWPANKKQPINPEEQIWLSKTAEWRHKALIKRHKALFEERKGQ